jgi:nucleotide-binding universal stress UspA family protein
LNARASGSPAIAKADTLAGYAQDAGADVFAVGGFARSRVRQIGPSSVTRDVGVGATLPMLITG